ncbi:T9SS type A sorting domain-containing protein [Aequorivita lipolytica]|uniref:T9SS type A sorting domain-containing protein n=1 Tax=Aequorivita lipolytica TaxID=153267 RepID=A0A5C6YKR2_9FLAO|nr:T9SS type A sorting domain-containing protein [Aequorivita lipolytica]TXD67967.1 T9SS type A sorting domain-containing protein [Aequorivita lipolytica]SRX51498.1 hypothetical protein AEQU2_01981 [Aequorivita lipolytica]
MKNLLLFSTLFLTTAAAFAQLTVKPVTGPGAADSFIYVNDQVLFVKNEINLTRNTSGPANTEASIYLRNNAQLIQEGATSNNTGDGQLSVQQNTPVTNAYAYYLWCSPIGNTSLTTGNQNFGVGQVYEPLPLPSTSVTASRIAQTTTGRDGTANPLIISTRWLYTFETPGTEKESNYKRMNSGNNAPPGFGFTMKGVGFSNPGGEQIYDFRGRPNSGTFTITVGPGLMTLTGNPYPSALDLNKLFYDSENTAALGTFWYYDEDRTVPSHYYATKPFGYGVYTIGDQDTDNNPYDGDNLGIYVSSPFSYYTSGGGQTPAPGTPGNDQNKRFAPIGQGIMFVGDAAGTVKIKNSHRVFFKEDTTGSIFQRPGSNNEITEVNANNGENISQKDLPSSTEAEPDYRTSIMRIWSIFDEAVTRDMVIAFYDQATDGYDRGLDGLSAQDLQTDAYFPIGNDNDRKPYVINGIKYDLSKQVPIAFKIKNQTKLDLKVVEEVKKPYSKAYLFDSQENTYQQISGGNSATLNLAAGKYENRFFVVFRNPNVKRDIPEEELSVKNIVLENVTFFQNNPSQQLEVRNPEGYVIKSASVFDMNGKLVISEKNLGDNSKYSFYTGNLSDGVYLVKLMTADDVAIDYKAIVHN